MSVDETTSTATYIQHSWTITETTKGRISAFVCIGTIWEVGWLACCFGVRNHAFLIWMIAFLMLALYTVKCDALTMFEIW